MRWLLLDEIIEIRPDERVLAKSRIPDTGAQPEFLLIEMMVQTGSLLLGLKSDYSEDVVITKIETAEFKSAWEPDDVVFIESTCDQLREEGAWMTGSVRSANGPVASCRFLLMNVGHLKPENTNSITFHKQFMEYFQIRDKIIVSSI